MKIKTYECYAIGSALNRNICMHEFKWDGVTFTHAIDGEHRAEIEAVHVEHYLSSIPQMEHVYSEFQDATATVKTVAKPKAKVKGRK